MSQDDNGTTFESPAPAAVEHKPVAPAKKSLGRKIWTFVQIMNVRLRFIMLMVLIGLVVGNWEIITNHYDRWQRPGTALDAVAHADTEYYCPMHPHIISDHPANCPLCGMPLSMRQKSQKHELPAGVLAQVQLTPHKVMMGRIGTSPVQYRLLSYATRSVGLIDYDETRRQTVSSRIKGRLDTLMVNYVGQKVSKGDPLAAVYSPELLVAQEELQSASRAVKDQKGATGSGLAQTSEILLEAAKKKLQLLGLLDSQIEDIIKRGTPQTHVTIFSPIAGIVTEKKKLEGQYVMDGEEIFTVADLGNVWLQAKIFESDISGIAPGTAVEVTTTAYPNELFAGRITFVAYSVDPATRTVSARVEITNPEYKLKPGMFVDAVIRLPAGKVTEISSSSRPANQVVAAAPTQAVAKAYLALAQTFALDKPDATLLAELKNQAQTLVSQLPQAQTLVTQLADMEGKTLDVQRQRLGPVSQTLIKLLQEAPPEMELYIANCPMDKGGDWITSVKDIENPYYGSEMLTCGSIIGPLKRQKALDSGRYVEGYYCPIRPGEIYETPIDCLIDKFPVKKVRIEKVLALPESAVIDTGTRKVVYRQSQPGVFQMVEVTLGKRAGEYYPVLAGLNENEQVATAGAFLVDAENRLNPAASVQYSGASGSPQGSGGQHK